MRKTNVYLITFSYISLIYFFMCINASCTSVWLYVGEMKGNNGQKGGLK